MAAMAVALLFEISITQSVTDRWLKGNVVGGEYARYACPQGADGFCFDGIEIERGSKSNG
jgi:hypothetical protein